MVHIEKDGKDWLKIDWILDKYDGFRYQSIYILFKETRIPFMIHSRCKYFDMTYAVDRMDLYVKSRNAVKELHKKVVL